MTGTITFTLAGERVTATLDEHGNWHCQNDGFEKLLNAGFDPEWFNTGPAGGNKFVKAINAAAKALGGTANIQEDEESPGVRY